ncbi:hypothetical protein OIDMADRAFT_113727 [Oidiodendron maius Zn]|uniref:25S rRNA (Uridine(2843)-N(3))-methyltransferase n=1 Tax=Oidiodendron maius (strain Zn) TaxID=913774 RepID=A0A0C3HR42_OIDMZ|nr:hypothetical protein OIDMADRAFT_113727 [Oidiodendron maius Zn]
MGKNGRFGKDYGKVVGKDSPSRPGWKGPGYVKKSEPPAKAKAKTSSPESLNVASEPVIPSELQQLLLDIFRNTFPEILAADTLQSMLQDVKTALYDRDFSRAFGKPEFLTAYSVRWSPSRALCYLFILAGIQELLAQLMCLDAEEQKDLASPSTRKSSLKVVCFGGGAAEVIAFGGFLNGPSINLHLVDTAQWGDAVQMLSSGLHTPPPLSKYASSAAREANSALLPAGSITTTFQAKDILDLSQDHLNYIIGKRPILLTLFFTLNELYAASIGKTTALLLKLTLVAKPGTLLLVVDSPGSYSETTVGKDAKKYPIQWLLDHALLETEKSRGEESTASWRKLFSDDSRWFRLPDGLRYPIPLENMRYQISLYQRL